jgi:glycosyltransferase involved in cell wall biosynthesis
MKKVAFIVPRYGQKIYSGAEIHAYLLALHLKKFADITILTTQASDHISWKNSYNKQIEKNEDIVIKRFPVDFPRNFHLFNNLTHLLFLHRNHTLQNEITWIKVHGPYSSKLFTYLADNKNTYDLFFFFGAINSLSYFGIKQVSNKSILIPLVHTEPALGLSIFDSMFRRPYLIIPSTRTERDAITERFYQHSPLFTIGVGVDVPTNIPPMKIDLKNPYIIFIGRFEKNKGIFDLLSYFNEFKRKYQTDLKLILIGQNINSISRLQHIELYNNLSEENKYFLIKNSQLLINSSYYESLSLTLLEAWSMKKSVLVNGRCDVLREQVIQANGGLYYRNGLEFNAMLYWLLKHHRERDLMGNNGYMYINTYYSWPIIEKKFQAMIDAF